MPENGLVCRNVGLIRKDAGNQEHRVLDSIDAVFPAGSARLISGPTGAGKSSLIHVLGGLLRPSYGEVIADGEPVSRWISAHRDRWRRKVGIVFQHLHLLTDMTVLENIMLPMISQGQDMRELRLRAVHALERLGAVELADRMVVSLSGGEKQVTAIARAVVSSPKFFLADEPTAHQDGSSLERILLLMEELQQRRVTVVVTTHDVRLEQAFPRDHVYPIAEGKLIW